VEPESSITSRYTPQFVCIYNRGAWASGGHHRYPKSFHDCGDWQSLSKWPTLLNYSTSIAFFDIVEIAGALTLEMAWLLAVATAWGGLQ